MGILEAYFTPNNKVNNFKYRKRISVCNKCSALNPTFRSCGKPLIGGKAITKEGDKIELCGCFIDEKAKFSNQQCPANKW